MRIAVIGSGIAGVCAAYYLAKDGHEITVFDREPNSAMQTSFANGGQVSVCNSSVWTKPSTVWKAMKWLFKDDAPLLFSPSLEPEKLRWLAGFLKNTFSNVYEENTAKTIAMGLESRLAYEEIIEDTQISFDRLKCGLLHFYRDPESLEEAMKDKDLFERNGCEWQKVSPSEIGQLDPSLAQVKGLVGGVWTPSDWTGDIHLFCVKLAKHLQSSGSVQFVYRTEVQSLDVMGKNRVLLMTRSTALQESADMQAQTFDAAVIANGHESVRLAKMAGERICVYPVKGYSITVDLNTEQALQAAPSISLLDDKAKIVTSRLGDRLRIAGTAELAGNNKDIRMVRVEPLLRWLNSTFPEVSYHRYTPWACLRPMSTDMLPIVKQVADSPVFLHTGHGHLGWTLSAGTAKKLASLVSVKTSNAFKS